MSRRKYTIRREAGLHLTDRQREMLGTAWIGRNIKREVLAEHLAHLGKRLGEVPEFAAYAIADGIKRAFTRFGKWVRTAAVTGPFQTLPRYWRRDQRYRQNHAK